jgi:hypothetical protein
MLFEAYIGRIWPIVMGDEWVFGTVGTQGQSPRHGHTSVARDALM